MNFEQQNEVGKSRDAKERTSDALGDMAGQSTFHSNKVWLRLAE